MVSREDVAKHALSLMAAWYAAFRVSYMPRPGRTPRGGGEKRHGLCCKTRGLIAHDRVLVGYDELASKMDGQT